MNTYLRYEQLKKRRNISNYRVAKDTGIGGSTLSFWKHGKRNISLTTLQKLAYYFNVPITYFLEPEYINKSKG